MLIGAQSFRKTSRWYAFVAFSQQVTLSFCSVCYFSALIFNIVYYHV